MGVSRLRACSGCLEERSLWITNLASLEMETLLIEQSFSPVAAFGGNGSPDRKVPLVWLYGRSAAGSSGMAECPAGPGGGMLSRNRGEMHDHRIAGVEQMCCDTPADIAGAAGDQDAMI